MPRTETSRTGLCLRHGPPRCGALAGLGLAIALASLSGCTKGRAPYAHSLDAAVAAASAAPSAPPAAPTTREDGSPVPPAGTPSAPEDLKRLSNAAAAGQPDKQPGAPPVERVDAHRVRVGRVLVDREHRRVQVPARVNMSEGILEYYACATHGKLHESVLEVFAEPSHIHLGLLLVGHDTAVWDRSDNTRPPTLVKTGGALDLWVVWRDASGVVKVDAGEAWLYDRKTRTSPPPLDWFFHGSTFWQGRYAADSDRSVFALIPDEMAVSMLAGDKGNPYRGELQGFEVHKAVIPAMGTPVTLVIQPRGQPAPMPEGLAPTHSPTVSAAVGPGTMPGSMPLPREFAPPPPEGGAPDAQPQPGAMLGSVPGSMLAPPPGGEPPPANPATPGAP